MLQSWYVKYFENISASTQNQVLVTTLVTNKTLKILFIIRKSNNVVELF